MRNKRKAGKIRGKQGKTEKQASRKAAESGEKQKAQKLEKQKSREKQKKAENQRSREAKKQGKAAKQRNWEPEVKKMKWKKNVRKKHGFNISTVLGACLLHIEASPSAEDI